MASLRRRSSGFGTPLSTLIGLVAAFTLGIGCGGDEKKGEVDPSRSTLIASRAANLLADGQASTVLSVRLLDSDGNPVQGIEVALEVTGTGNILQQPSAATDKDGRTSGTLKSTVAEKKVITATAGSVKLDATPTVEFVNYVPPASKIAFGPLPAFVVGAPIAEPLKIEVQDSTGTIVSTDGREVTLTLGGSVADAKLAGTLTVAAVDGVATFSDLVIDKPGAGFALIASAPGLPPVTSEGFEVKVGAPAELAILELGLGATAGIKSSFTIAVLDALGNDVIDYAGTITFASSDPRAVLPAEFTFTAADKGRRVFTDGVMFKTVGDQNLTVTAKNQAALSDTAEIFVDSGAATRLELTGVAGPVPAGTTQSLTVKVLDAFDNPVLSYRGEVQFASTDSGAIIPSSYKFDSVDEGQHLFEGGVTFKNAGTWNLTAVDVANSELKGAINGIVVNAGPPGRLAFSVEPASVAVRTVLAPAMKVQILDEHGNFLSNATNKITLSLEAPPTVTGAVLGGDTEKIAVAGVATFSNLTIDMDGPSFVLKASSPGLADGHSQAFDVTDAVAPAKPTLNASATTVNSVTLSWTAPGDDGALGTATAYELRVAKNAAMTGASGVTIPAPKAGGQAETAVVSPLDANTLYYFELKTLDNVGNSSVATLNTTTAACPAGTSGPTCGACAEGFHKDPGGVCVDACTSPNPCSVPPTATCAGDVLTTYAATGTCTVTAASPFHTCEYAPTTTDCAAAGELCQNGACVADPCAGVTCVPPAATCGADGLTLTSYTSVCRVTGATHVCDNTPAETDCGATSQVCALGACVENGAAPAAGALVVTEVMHNPSGSSAERRWFEVKNVTAGVVSLSGLVVEEVDGAKTFELPATPMPLAAGAYFVFGGSSDSAVNGGAHVDFVWPSTFTLPLTGQLRIKAGATVVETFSWTAAFPSEQGKAMNLSSSVIAAGGNGRAWHWCPATAALSGGDFGTPGATNGDCGIAPVAPINWCVVQHPATIDVAIGASTDVYGRLYEPGVTERNAAGNDHYPFLETQVGFGVGDDASAWTTWIDGDFNPGYAEANNNDEHMAAVVFPSAGGYRYGWRMRLLDPATGTPSAWTYCDRIGVVAADPPVSADYGVATVTEGSQTQPSVVINEICSRGPAGADDDFIELFNPGTKPVSLEGYTLWYRSAAATGVPSHKTVFTAGHSIPAFGYFLVGSSTNAGYVPVASLNEPAADLRTSQLPLAGAAAQVLLTSTAVAPTGLDDPTLVDMVGYGTTAAVSLGSKAPVPPAGGSIERKTPGLNTKDNGVDFEIRAVRTPRSSAPDEAP